MTHSSTLRRVLLAISVVIALVVGGGSALIASSYAAEIHDNIVTSATLEPASGSGDPTVNSNNSTVQLKLDFKLPNNVIHQGDTSTVGLPEGFVFNASNEFDVTSSEGGVVAHAKFDASTGKLILTYTDYVEHHSDVTGTVKAAIRADSSKNHDYGTKDFVVNIDGHLISAGNLTYKQWTGDNPQEKFAKWGSPDYEKNEATYYLRINGVGNHMENVKVIDTLKSEGMSIIPGSFTVTKGKWYINDYGSFTMRDASDIDVPTYSIEYFNEQQGFTFNLGNLLADGSGILIKYRVKFNHPMLNGEDFRNYAEIKYKNQNEENYADSHTTWNSASGEANGYNYAIKLHKMDENHSPLAGAQFTLTRDSSGEKTVKTTDATGLVEFSGLLRDNYTLTETQAPEGYQLDSTPLHVTADQLKNDAQTFETNMVNKKATGTFSVKKTVMGDNMQKFSQDLYRVDYTCSDGTRGQLTVPGDGTLVSGPQVAEGSVCTVSENPDSAKKTDYTVATTYENQQVTIVSDKSVPVTVKNTYTRDTTSVKVSKVWNDADNQDGVRPGSVTVQLKANGHPSGEPVTLNEKNNWTYTWDKLAKSDNGTDIIYTVEETSTGRDYQATVTGDQNNGFTVTNTHQTKTTSVRVSKVWNDADNQDGARPSSVMVQLKADGQPLGNPIELTQRNEWKYEWTNLPEFKAGKPVRYTVEETSTGKDYQATVAGNQKDGYTVTNTHQTKVTSVRVSKVWNDADNQDGIRPSSVTVVLKANGKIVGSPVKLLDSNKWSYEWKNIPVFAHGQQIRYTVEETSTGKEYQATVTGDQNNGFTVTNTHHIQMRSIRVVKAWDDKNDQDKIRPDKVTVVLKANGKMVGSPIELSHKTQWAYEWTDLPVFNHGQQIHYSVDEVSTAQGYTETIHGSMSTGFTVINSHTPVPPRPVKNTPKTPGKSSPRLASTGTDVNTMMIFTLFSLIIGSSLVTYRKVGRR